MFTPYYHKQFKKDIRNCKKEGKEMKKIKIVIRKLLENKNLESKYRLHKLSGVFKNRFECHIQPDWLLIFKKDKDSIIFERTGSHSKLFK
ncbi:type II toxin-antitoxin system YafQ family toxin [Candidatus Parcubacteria bacterium]|nr:type II toxin-antitoxin system YafQ family toxin [Candidatus Parcubacteria bacterium]